MSAAELRVFTKIEQLVEALDSADSSAGYQRILKRLAIPKEQWAPFISYRSDCYNRAYVRKTQDYELLVLSWENNQYTKIHNHMNSSGWIYIVQGSVEEIVYRILNSDVDSVQLEEIKKNQYKESQIQFITDKIGVHRIKNCSEGRSVTLHLYSPPITECRCYENTGLDNRYKTVVHCYEPECCDNTNCVK